MDSFSLSRDLTFILKNSQQEYCRLWGRNALGKLSGVTISPSGLEHSDTATGEDASPQSALTLPVNLEDVEILTTPSPETFFPLPVAGQATELPPVGAMFCDVYRRDGDRFEKDLSAPDVTDPADLPDGITGSGVEFFYPLGTEEYRETKWELSVPMFRDPMTPSYPRETIRGLFEYGQDEPSRSSVTRSSQQPTLRSAI